MKNRKMTTAEAQKHNIPPTVPLLLHWDTKLLPGLTRTEKVDRVAVLVTGEDHEILLGVPPVFSSTGTAQADACLGLLREQGLEENIRGIVFDTTASNTGLSEGACVKIQHGLNRDLLWAACRHHVHEIILSDVFKKAYGQSSGPNIELFVRFQKQWKNIDNTCWIPATEDEDLVLRFSEDDDLIQAKSSAVEYLRSALEQKSHPRVDYAALLFLSLLFLGGIPDGSVNIRTPGAFHQARWMAKAIYVLKIYLFKAQFKLSVREMHAMRSLGLFITLSYVRYWNEAMIARYAAKNDLDFMHHLQSGLPDKSLAETALTAWKRHLWYVSEEMIGLAFFDERINSSEKSAMILNLKRPPNDKVMKRLEGKNFSPRQSVSEFVTAKTMTIFETLIPNGAEYAVQLLQKVPEDWEEDPIYKRFKMACDKMRVVNDCAERAISLATKFNSTITKDEQQKQYILTVVRKHQQDIPCCSKVSFIE
jgi:hypothetical protein